MSQQQPIEPIRFHGLMFDLSGQVPTIVNMNEGDPNKVTIVYDLDGTIANDEHRLQYVTDPATRDYVKYYSLIKDDTPNWPVIHKLIEHHQGGANIVIITGREDTYLMPTIQQLYMFQIAEYINYIVMRPTGCYIKAAEYKERAIQMIVQEGCVLAGFVDDSEPVRKMVAELGIVTFDPAEIILDSKAPKIILPS